METRPLLSALLLTVAAIVNAENEGYITALNSVPATDKSIQRFPETGSKYDGVLKDYRGVAFHPNMTEMVVVGANGYVFRLDLETFSIQNTSMSENIVKIIPDAETYETCVRYNGKGECFNTMMGVVYNGTSGIFACGTHAKNPRCWMLSMETLNITSIVRGLEKDIFYENEFCPKYEYGSVMPIYAASGAIFGATWNLRNPDKHSIRAIFPDGQMIRSAKPKKHFKDPIFKWAYDGGDGFVYYFFHEKAEEVSEITERPYDIGPYIHSSEHFMSYSKSQIVCSKAGWLRADYYDHIESATAVTMHDSTGKPEVYIYASFTTTLFSTGSSAICRYKFSDMTKVFQTSKYCSRTMGITDCRTTTYAKNPSVNVAKMKCNANLDTWKFQGWDSIWVNEYPLLHDDIESADGTILVTFRGERITAIAVDDLHYNVSKTDVGKHVIFAAAAESGKIFKIMMNSTNKGVPVFLEEIQAVKGSGNITKLTLYEDYIIATGRHVPLMKIAKERCESKFLSCSDCIKSRDPYCAWSLKQNKCARAANLKPSDRIQDVAVGNDLKCPPATRPTTISTVKDDTRASVVMTSPIETTSKHTTKSTTDKKRKKLITSEKFIKRTLTKKSTKSPTTWQSPVTAGKRCASPAIKGKETDKYFVPFIVCLIILILGILAVTFNFCVGRMGSEKVNYNNTELGGRKSTLDVTAQKAATTFKKRTKSDATKSGKPLALQDRENSRHFLVDEQADNMGFTTEVDDQAHTKA